MLEATERQEHDKAKTVLAAYSRAGEELASTGRISNKTKKITQQPFIKIPLAARVARHIPLFRPFIEKEVGKRANNISRTIGVKE